MASKSSDDWLKDRGLWIIVILLLSIGGYMIKQIDLIRQDVALIPRMDERIINITTRIDKMEISQEREMADVKKKIRQLRMEVNAKILTIGNN